VDGRSSVLRQPLASSPTETIEQARWGLTDSVSSVPVASSLPPLMRAAVLHGRGDMRVTAEYPVSEPGFGEVVVRVAACAICGTDPDILNYGWPSQPPYGEFIFGHEFSGTVIACGPGVTRLSTGDRVAAETHKGCGVCPNCRDGLYTTCLNYGNRESGHRHYGFTENGAYAEYVLIHESCIHQIPEQMPFEVATLVTTAGTSLYGILRLGGLQGGETVVVSGPGPIGLMAVVVARLAGAGTIVLVGTRPERLELGLQLGADLIINAAGEEVVARVNEITEGRGADVAMECAGTEASAAAAVEYTRMSGRIAFLGIHTESPIIALNARKIALGNLTVSGVRAEGGRSVSRALELLRRSSVDISPLITHAFGLEDIKLAFDVVSNRLDGAVKVVIRP